MAKTRSRAPRLSANALTVLRRRYLAKNAAGVPIESPADMFRRVAENIAEAEHLYSARAKRSRIVEEFYRIITQLEFLPNSPTLMNAGRDLQQLSACFVLPVEDSLESIFDAVKHQALIHQSGGGTGFSFSHLRPKHDRVASTSGVASGPVSFMKIFNMATEVIKQGGCVAPDTFVSTNRGMVPICELGPVDAAPHTWHPHATNLIVATDGGSRPSDEFYVHGVAPVRRIRTRRGYRLSATLEHRIRVIDKDGRYVWRRLKDLRPGDWAVLQKGHLLEPEDYRLPALNHAPHHNASPVSVPSEASARLGEFIGFVIGDGSFNRYNREGSTGRLIITVCDDQPEIHAWLLNTCRELFGITSVAQQKINDRSTNYYLNATTLVSWLHQLGVEKSSALTARIPAIVFRKGRQMACGFLRGLFTADGTVSRDGYPSLSSVSQGLVEDAQQLLLAVGIPSRVSITTQRQGAFGANPLYRLHIQTIAGLEQFARQIGFIDTARSALLTRARRPSWEFNDVIPNQHHVLAELYAGPGRGSGPMRKSRGANRTLYRAIQHYLPGVLSQRNLTRSRLAALAEDHVEIRNSPLAWFLKHDQFYDQIETIEEDRSPTVDLSVPGRHTYIANGFVSHNTRRGANMGILRVDHPDILDFIAAKENPGELTNFNVSVGITDAFMHALKHKSSYALINPRTGRPAGRLSATEVFDRLAEAAWRTGEPGVVFLDTINAANPTPHLGRIEATNPCVTADTWVHTLDGPRQVKDLIGAPFVAQVNGEFHVSGHTGFFKTGTKPVIQLNTVEGYSLRLTADHLIRRVVRKTRHIVESDWCRAGDLLPGDSVILNDHRANTAWKGCFTFEQGYLLGLLIGDGVLKEDKAVLSIWHTSGKGVAGLRNEAMRCAATLPHRSDFHGWIAVPGRQESRVALAALRDFAVSCGMTPGNKAVTAMVEQGSSDFYRGFLRAFFDTDGSVQGTLAKGVSVRLSQSDRARLQAVQRMLLRLGIASTIYANRGPEGTRNLPDGRGGRRQYRTQSQHELTVSGDNLLRYQELVGFSDPEKATKLSTLLRTYRRRLNRERFIARVKDIGEAGIEDVYDAQISGIHAFDANGFLVHNCGEQPLLPYESCTLGSINVGRFVKGSAKAPSIDYDRLAQVIPVAVRFLDNVIDMNRYPLPEIETMTQNTRKIGLGIMGFADLLIKLGIPYDTGAALKTAEALMRFVQARAHAASAELAKERGVFPSFKGSRLESEGRRFRNATVTTIAPTGTISIIADCSPGIEPLYGVSFVRTVMEDVRLVTVHPEFVRRLRAAGLYSPALLRRVAANESIRQLTDLPADLRRLFATAHDVAPDHHVRMQAVFQKYSDSGVSKTVNLPPTAAKRDVASVFLLAYRLGCKGITVFRSGSREKQVLSCAQIQYC